MPDKKKKGKKRRDGKGWSGNDNETEKKKISAIIYLLK